MVEARDLRALPVEGMSLIEWVFEGSGKDAELRITAADGRRFVLDVDGPRLHTDVRGRVHAEIRSMGDVTLRVRLSAPHLVLTEAKVRYPGGEVEWEEDMARFQRGRPMSWAISGGRFILVGEEGGR